MEILILKIYDDVLSSIMEGCCEALRELGHRVRVVDISGPQDPRETLNKEINDSLPDFLFTINHLGLTFQILDLLSSLKLPYVSWWVDNPLSLTISKEFKSNYLTLFVWDRFYVEKLKTYGFKRVYHLSLATNPNIFREIHLTQEEEVQFGCDLSFVGGAFYNGFLAYKEWQKGKDLAARNLLEQTLKVYFENPSLDIRDVFRTVKEILRYDLSIEEERDLVVKLELIGMSLYRKEVIEEIKDLGFCLYGDEGWPKMVGRRIKFLGRIDYQDLPKLYTASKINLNITKPQLKTAINQRVFDVAACGAFLLSDFRHDLIRLFEIEKEAIFYRDKEDLREKINYFLSHPEKREEISNRAKKKVLKEHTYLHRMRDLIEIMRGGAL